MNKRIREVSPIGSYHVCVRAHDGKPIFDDMVVRMMFIDRMVKAFHKYEVKIPGWTLMTNHAHMVVEGDIEMIARAFQSIGGSFCRWFNRHKGGKGAVFDSRYYLKPISDRFQYVTCLAYIFNNPVRAKMVNRAQDYKWTTFGDIMNPYFKLADRELLVEHEMIEEVIQKVHEATDSSDSNLDPMPRIMVSDFDVENALKDNFPTFDPLKAREASSETEIAIVTKMIKVHNTAHTMTNAFQIARITGIRYHRVRKILTDSY